LPLLFVGLGVGVGVGVVVGVVGVGSDVVGVGPGAVGVGSGVVGAGPDPVDDEVAATTAGADGELLGLAGPGTGLVGGMVVGSGPAGDVHGAGAPVRGVHRPGTLADGVPPGESPSPWSRMDVRPPGVIARTAPTSTTPVAMTANAWNTGPV
jgi:hypothetical protein